MTLRELFTCLFEGATFLAFIAAIFAIFWIGFDDSNIIQFLNR